MSDPTTIRRAQAYLDSCAGAVSGQGGHDATFAVACALVKGFDLSQDDAMDLMSSWNRKCDPEWSEAELLHKTASADEAPDAQPRGYILRARPSYIAPAEGARRTPALNPQRPSSAPTIDIQLWRETRLAMAGLDKFNDLPDWSIEELMAFSPLPLPQTAEENFEAYLNTAWSGEPNLLWLGHVQSTGSPADSCFFAHPAVWLRRGIPNSDSLWTSGCTFPRGCYQRKKSTMIEHRYLVVESDRHSYNRQCAIIRYLLSLGLPLKMVVDTCGSSLHAWIDRRELSEQYIARLEVLLCGIHDGLEDNPEKPGHKRRKFLGGMGCDPATFRGSQPARLPGATRPATDNKRGGIQRIIYLS